MSGHGHGRYVRGCHECQAREARYKRQWRMANRERTTPDHVHGTVNGYSNHNCRCAECTEAQRLSLRAFRSKAATS